METPIGLLIALAITFCILRGIYKLLCDLLK